MPDAFDHLGLEPRFDLDAAAVKRAWRARAGRLHPDRVVDNALSSDTSASRAAAELNEARRDLVDPERRAEVLLTRLGGPGKGEDQSLPPGFLLEIMERREALEEALAAGEHVGGFAQWAADEREGRIRRVGELFMQAASDPGRSAEILRAVRLELNAWRYIERMIEQLDDDSPRP